MNKINYIVAFYFGSRRCYQDRVDKYIFLRKQLEFLKKCVCNEIVAATLVFNMDENSEIEIINKIISNYGLEINLHIIFRNNMDFSYGAWNDGVLLTYGLGYNYHFLIEDDYIPTDINFYIPFLNKINNQTCFACVKVFDDPVRHPAISNGLLSNNAVVKVLKNKTNIIPLNAIHDENSYANAENSQKFMMNYFEEIGFNFTEIDEIYSKPFLNAEKNIVFYGGSETPPLQPIIID